MSSGRGSQVTRQWAVLGLLEGRRGGLSAEEIAGEVGARVRTVYRDLEQLQAAGVPLVAERAGPNSRWRFSDGYRRRFAAPLDLLEVCALASVRTALAPLAGSPLGDAALRAVLKIRAGLPAAILERLDEGAVLEVVSESSSVGERAVLVGQLTEAIVRRLTVEARYHSRARGRATARRLDPYQFLLRAGVLYLAAHCHDRGTVRTFRVDRFRVVQLSDRRFPRPGFRLDEYLADSFGVTRGTPVTVRIAVSSRIAELFRSQVHHRSQRLEEREDGLVVGLRVAPGPELIAFVLSLGADAEVLEPHDLRRAVAHAAAATALRYEDAGELTLRREAAHRAKEPPGRCDPG